MKIECVRRNIESEYKGFVVKQRDDGLVPAVAYGKGFDNLTFFIDHISFVKNHKKIKSSIVTLKVNDREFLAYVKSCDIHPVTMRLMHVDFLLVNENDSYVFDVPVTLVSTDVCEGVKYGGSLNLVKRSLLVECVPSKMPKSINIDVANLGIGDVVKKSSIVLDEGVNFSKKEKCNVIVTVVGRKVRASKKEDIQEDVS
ncbi:MAG: ribosomal protein L25, Ctc-form [Candidatus Xenolissoclinum pacificiensis L6]|uniref:Large ribosomal subunit protein bL25 n=1 Tax=Candidatus Xenolissoclinum pacificiensis L6 TaxID=1401685 RepID=W2V0B7_9RICK|nr:MAG: ribosomal protein L25, Ctc-form [Candidatus Xenolissoclinum pacificiensis L6]